MKHPSIYTYVQSEETNFQSDEVRVGDNWTWNFRNHVQLIFHLANGIFYTGENNWMRPFKNIMEPILELCAWTEDIELKDIVFTIEESRVLSFLIKKYHDEVYAKKHNLDEMIDDIIESDLEYGAVLIQEGKDCPEVLPLNTVAFCDQTKMLGGPIGFKHNFSPDGLREMVKMGWGNEKNGATVSIEELIEMAEHVKDPAGLLDTKTNRTTGKNIEVYIIRGTLPEAYLLDNNNMEYYCHQLHIIAFYYDHKHVRQGVTLYRKKESEGKLKFFTSKEVFGRAIGRGVGERLLGPQVWTNFLTIHKTSMLEGGAKTPLMTDDPAFAQRNKVQEMENNEITVLSPETKIPPTPIQTVNPVNVQLYDKSINEWFSHAQLTGAAFDPLIGEGQVSGTTFRGQERQVQQGEGPHKRRRGKRAKFIEEVYRDWIIPRIRKEILGGKKFLATLTTEEMQWMSEQLAQGYANRERNEDVLSGKIPRDEEELKRDFLTDFSKGGSKRLLKILEGEFEDVDIKLDINVAGKQKDLVGLSDKVLSIFQFVFQNPAGFMQTMKIPGMARAFQDILEYSGVNSVDFAALVSAPQADPMMQPTDPQQMQQVQKPQMQPMMQ